MTPLHRHRHLAFFVVLFVFVAGMLGSSAFALWRLRADAIVSGLEIAELHGRVFEELLTQNLRTIEVVAANIVEQEVRLPSVGNSDNPFTTTLARAPFMRSMSLLDERGRVIASSNPANLGLAIATENYLPLSNGKVGALRIGSPWSGRDFADGTAAEEGAGNAPEAPGFVPISQTIRFSARTLTLLVTLNPDYFINQITQRLDSREGSAAVYRYDGVLLMSTDPADRPGSKRPVTRDLRLDEVESGSFENLSEQGRHELTAFRASRLYPLVVITRLDREYAVRHWTTEARILLGIVIPAVLAIGLFATVFYRRQTQIEKQRDEFRRLQRINATVFESSTEAILITGLDARILSINPAFTRITGYHLDELAGHHLFEYLTQDGIDSFTRSLPSARQHGVDAEQTVAIEAEQRCKDGRLIWMEILSTPELDARGQITGYRRICRNITERRLADEKLRLSANVFTHAREGILITDVDGTIIDVNEAFSLITGYSRAEVLGNNPRMLKSERQDEAFYGSMWRDLSEHGHWHGEIWNRRKNGDLLAEILTISAVRDRQGNVRQYVALFTDITPLKVHERELERAAHYDGLTDLPNRILLADRMQQAMVQAQRRGQTMAVAFIDLDGFKAINDNYGHEAGDLLLKTVSRNIKRTLREGDTLARLGGDEFVAMLIDLSDAASGIPMLIRILEAAALPVPFGETMLCVSASLGVTYYPQADEVEASQLLRQADQAMYQAKLDGKNRYHIFAAQTDACSESL